MIASLTDHTAETLRVRLTEAEDMLRAIRQGEVDAVVVESASGNQVYTLHSAEEPYRNLVEQMQEGAVMLTARGDILYSNARFAALVGAPLASVVGTPIARFINPLDGSGFDALMRAGTGRCRTSVIGPTTVPIEVSISLTAVPGTQPAQLSLIVTDLSEILEANRSRARAEHDNRTKDEFLAMLGHELRTPLGAIRTAAHILESVPAASEPATRAQEVIARQVSHITHLVNDLLDVERVVSGKIRLDRQPLDLAVAVRHAVTAFTGSAQLDRQFEISTEPAWVDVDSMRLEQIVTNLVANAVKYSQPGSCIRVGLRADGGDAVLTVQDEGFGISPRLLPFIFDLYVQADRTLDRAEGGLGIGLTLVRRLVELHGGTIVAASEGEGHGSLFTVRLRQISAARAGVHLTTSPERRARPRRVLVIEDSNDAREMLRMMIELAGHSVYDAPDGIRGIELVNAMRPDAAIIDIGLPGMDGYQVAKRIREDPHGRGMLLMALTGYDSPSDRQRSTEHGFDHHLVKPVDPDRLARLLSGGAES